MTSQAVPKRDFTISFSLSRHHQFYHKVEEDDFRNIKSVLQEKRACAKRREGEADGTVIASTWDQASKIWEKFKWKQVIDYSVSFIIS